MPPKGSSKAKAESKTVRDAFVKFTPDDMRRTMVSFNKKGFKLSPAVATALVTLELARQTSDQSLEDFISTTTDTFYDAINTEPHSESNGEWLKAIIAHCTTVFNPLWTCHGIHEKELYNGIRANFTRVYVYEDAYSRGRSIIKEEKYAEINLFAEDSTVKLRLRYDDDAPEAKVVEVLEEGEHDAEEDSQAEEGVTSSDAMAQEAADEVKADVIAIVDDVEEEPKVEVEGQEVEHAEMKDEAVHSAKERCRGRETGEANFSLSDDHRAVALTNYKDYLVTYPPYANLPHLLHTASERFDRVFAAFQPHHFTALVAAPFVPYTNLVLSLLPFPSDSDNGQSYTKCVDLTRSQIADIQTHPSSYIRQRGQDFENYTQWWENLRASEHNADILIWERQWKQDHSKEMEEWVESGAVVQATHGGKFERSLKDRITLQTHNTLGYLQLGQYVVPSSLWEVVARLASTGSMFVSAEEAEERIAVSKDAKMKKKEKRNEKKGRGKNTKGKMRED